MSTSLEPFGESKYSEIARVLRRRIELGELGPGAGLPRLADLAREHGTTLVTARRALRQLEVEGLVRVEHGVGSFVADWSGTYDLPFLPPFGTQVDSGSSSVVTDVVSRGQDGHHPEAAAALEVEPNARLPWLKRRRRVETATIAIQHTYFHPTLAAACTAYPAGESLYAFLADQTGRSPISADEELTIVPAPVGVAEHFVSPSTALLLSRRIARDAAGRPLVFDEAWLHPEAVRITVRRRGGRAEMRLEIRGGTRHESSQNQPAVNRKERTDGE